MIKKLLFSVLLGFSLCASAGDNLPLPSFKHLPHYMTKMKCDDFSKEALAFLHSQGIPAHRITYGWHRIGGQTGYHAAVIFQRNSRYYFMDNACRRPWRVAAKTDLGVVHQVDGDHWTMVWMTDEQNRRVAPRKMADLFAPNPDWMRSIQVRPR